MDLKQLEYFIAIAEEGKITLAAQRLQITDAGKMFLIRAKQIVDLSHTARQEMEDYARGYEGTILLGITPTAVPLVLSDSLVQFHSSYPKISFEVFEGDTSYILDLVQKGIVDVGIVRSPIHCSSLCQLDKPSEPMVAVMLPELNWSACNECTLEELDGKNVILYRRYESLVLEEFAAHQVVPRIVGKCDRSYTAMCIAESGLGIAILPAGAIRMSQKHMVFKTITTPELCTNTVAVWQPSRHLSKSVQVFLDYFQLIA